MNFLSTTHGAKALDDHPLRSRPPSHARSLPRSFSHCPSLAVTEAIVDTTNLNKLLEEGGDSLDWQDGLVDRRVPLITDFFAATDHHTVPADVFTAVQGYDASRKALIELLNNQKIEEVARPLLAAAASTHRAYALQVQCFIAEKITDWIKMRRTTFADAPDCKRPKHENPPTKL